MGEGLGQMRWSIERIALAVAGLVWCAALGVLAARILTEDDAQARGPTVLRTDNGVTETGVVETMTIDGAVRRVIHWRTREDSTITQTVDGPMQLRTIQGKPTPGSTFTLPGETVTVTVPNTVTEVTTVTETVQNTPTETVTAPTP